MSEVAAPDLRSGVPLERVPEGGMIQGKVGEEDVILARRGEEFFAVGARCTHYGGPLGRGLVVGDQLRCPLHHASFSLRTGVASRAPAFDPIPCWRVQGQVAACHILGCRERFDAVPYFWTRQYGVSVKHVAHAPAWDAIEIAGSLEAKDCAVAYKRAGRTLAVATVGRDVQSLQAEAALEAALP